MVALNMKNFFKHIKLNPEITHGVCPNCDEFTALVSLTRDFYRCVTCGQDLEQKVNGKISYIPADNVENSIKLNVPQKG